jgi:outer membrane murein-binding lipoprotein Lpp
VRTLMQARTEQGDKLAAAVQESAAKVDTLHQVITAAVSPGAARQAGKRV